jgi:hypothetical protein
VLRLSLDPANTSKYLVWTLKDSDSRDFFRVAVQKDGW